MPSAFKFSVNLDLSQQSANRTRHRIRSMPILDGYTGEFLHKLFDNRLLNAPMPTHRCLHLLRREHLTTDARLFRSELADSYHLCRFQRTTDILAMKNTLYRNTVRGVNMQQFCDSLKDRKQPRGFGL